MCQCFLWRYNEKLTCAADGTREYQKTSTKTAGYPSASGAAPCSARLYEASFHSIEIFRPEAAQSLK